MSSASVTMMPSKPSSSRSSPVMMGCDMVAGAPLGSSAGTTMWALMIGVHAAPDRLAERRQVDLVQLGAAVRDDGQAGVRIGVGVAVAGEVLGGAGDAAAVVAAHRLADHPCHQLRVGAEGAHPDDRVVRVDVDVGDRCVVLVDADGGQLGADDTGGREGVGRRTGRAQRHVAGHLGGRLGQPVDDGAALLVDGDDQREAARVLQAVGELRDLPGVAHVVGAAAGVEVDDGTRPVLGDDLGRGVHAVQLAVARVHGLRALPVDLDDEQLAELLLQGHPRGQFTDLAVVGVRRPLGRGDRGAGEAQRRGDASRAGQGRSAGGGLIHRWHSSSRRSKRPHRDSADRAAARWRAVLQRSDPVAPRPRRTRPRNGVVRRG